MTEGEAFVAKHKGKRARHRHWDLMREGTIGEASKYVPTIVFIRTKDGAELACYWYDLELWDEPVAAKTKRCECGAST